MENIKEMIKALRMEIAQENIRINNIKDQYDSGMIEIEDYRYDVRKASHAINTKKQTIHTLKMLLGDDRDVKRRIAKKSMEAASNIGGLYEANIEMARDNGKRFDRRNTNKEIISRLPKSNIKGLNKQITMEIEAYM